MVIKSAKIHIMTYLPLPLKVGYSYSITTENVLVFGQHAIFYIIKKSFTFLEIHYFLT